MRVVSDITTKQELEEMKVVMEIFVINDRIKQLIDMS
jgi:hypothetical protein